MFLRKLAKGGSEHSFGIHVAKLAGMPPSVIKKAEEILTDLEKSHKKFGGKEIKKVKNEQDFQLGFFELNDPVLQQIKMNLNILTSIA